MSFFDIGSIFMLVMLLSLNLIQKYIKERKKENIEKENSIDTFCNKHYKKIWIFFIFILLITVIYRFGEWPSYIGVDEAGMAYDSYCIENYGVDRYLNSYPLYLTNFGSGQSVLCSYLAILCIKIFGANMIAYRMPVLIIYILGTIASYLFISKAKNKKVALLFIFLILTCPWNIMNARQALDCNLYAGMLMINLFLMNRAKKTYQYILAGISVGITLYTYCLSWTTMPIFLLVWSIYMMYLKKITIKKLILFAFPIAIFAIPLIYFILLNYGIINQTQIGMVTFPILNEFRGNQIGISNIWENGLESLNTIFLSRNTIYLIYVPLFLIGYILSFSKMIKDIKKKEYSVEAIMVIVFTSIIIGLLFTKIPTPNKANMLYIPILFFVTIAILEISKYSKTILLISVLGITVLFINFEYKYYTKYINTPNSIWYEDESFSKLSKILEENIETKEMDKHVMIYRTSPYIYQVLANQMSPYEFDRSIQTRQYNDIVEITQVGNYHYYSYFYDKNRIKEIELEKENDIVIISKQFEDMIIYMENQNYEKQEYKDLYIFTNLLYDIKLNLYN